MPMEFGYIKFKVAELIVISRSGKVTDGVMAHHCVPQKYQIFRAA
jgi:hypothetical protein